MNVINETYTIDVAVSEPLTLRGINVSEKRVSQERTVLLGVKLGADR
jgi:hypothetical protein